MNNTIKYIGAALAGIIVGIVLSLGTDALLVKLEVLPKNNLWVPTGIIILILFYRTVYNILGTYIAARLSPAHPMRMAIVLGIIGIVVSVSGAIATANMNLGPGWYVWTLAVLSLPSAWVAGKLSLMKKQKTF